MKALRYIVFLVLLLPLLTGCNKQVFYTNDQRVNVEGWNMDDKLTFDVDVKDTTRLYTFLVDLRLTTDYPYSNTFFFINTTFPDGGVAADTLECPVATPDGQWMGKRTGGYIDNRYIFRKNMIFPAAGTYTFEIQHGMRDTNIVGIKNVGLRIEYADNK